MLTLRAMLTLARYVNSARFVKSARRYVNEYILTFFSKIGEDQSAEDAEDGPPELLVSAFILGT